MLYRRITESFAIGRDETFSRRASLLGHTTWAILVSTFIALLGGFHPSDQRRNTIIVIASVVIALVNIPSIMDVVARLRHGKRAREVMGSLIGLMLRLVIAAVVLQFVGSISHEQPKKPISTPSNT